MNYVGIEPNPLALPALMGQPNGIATLDGAGKVPNAQLPGGRIVQYAQHLRGDFLSQVAVIPLDDTIPQIGEGAEYFQVAGYVPLAIGNRIRISGFLNYSMSQTGQVAVFAVFRSGTPDALGVSYSTPVALDWDAQAWISAEFIVADLTPRTYSLRAGASAGALRLNGRTGRFFGGAFSSWLRVEEYSA